jgi:hypothetical protein
MKLNELFNAKADDNQKGDWYDEDLSTYVTTFKAGDREIDVTFDQVPRLGSHWDVGFSERSKRTKNKQSTAITGSGNEFEVFAKVIAIVKKFINDNSVDSLAFTADKGDRNRYKLYQRMVDRLTPKGWTKEVDETGDNKALFVITKDNDDKTFG